MLQAQEIQEARNSAREAASCADVRKTRITCSIPSHSAATRRRKKELKCLSIGNGMQEEGFAVIAKEKANRASVPCSQQEDACRRPAQKRLYGTAACLPLQRVPCDIT
jgi:hypothetical protein